MKRRDLLRLIGRTARERGIEWRLVRHGRDHDLWRCGALTVQVPRHREVNEDTGRAILRKLERQLGEDWWRR